MLDRLLPGEEEEHQKVFEKGIELKRKKLREIQVRTMKWIAVKRWSDIISRIKMSNKLCKIANIMIIYIFISNKIVNDTILFHIINCTVQAQKDILMIERMKGHQYGDSRRRDRESEM